MLFLIRAAKKNCEQKTLEICGIIQIHNLLLKFWCVLLLVFCHVEQLLFFLIIIGICETQFTHRVFVQCSHINARHVFTALNFDM